MNKWVLRGVGASVIALIAAFFARWWFYPPVPAVLQNGVDVRAATILPQKRVVPSAVQQNVLPASQETAAGVVGQPAQPALPTPAAQPNHQQTALPAQMEQSASKPQPKQTAAVATPLVGKAAQPQRDNVAIPAAQAHPPQQTPPQATAATRSAGVAITPTTENKAARPAAMSNSRPSQTQVPPPRSIPPLAQPIALLSIDSKTTRAENNRASNAPSRQTERSTAPTPKKRPSGTWIQAGSFSTLQRAKERLRKIKKPWMSGEIQSAVVHGKTHYRVYIGPLPPQAVHRALAGLKAANIEARVVNLNR